MPKTVWYCLKTYVGPSHSVRYIAQEYADHNLSWMDPGLVCADGKSCQAKCDELNGSK